MIQLEPTHNYLYIQIIVRDLEGDLVIPDSSHAADDEVIVLATGPRVEQIVKGDKVFLRPDAHIMVIEPKLKTGLVADTGVIAVVREIPLELSPT